MSDDADLRATGEPDLLGIRNQLILRLTKERDAALAGERAAREALARVEALLPPVVPAKYDANGYYEGRVGGSEHRTVGGRAWCYDCSEWCYPESYACPCCEPKIDPDDLRAALSPTPPDTAGPICFNDRPHDPHPIQRPSSDTGSRMVEVTCPGVPTPPDTAEQEPQR